MRTPVALRSWSVEDASALAELYARNRTEIERTEPWRAPTFFTTPGQLSRLTTAAAEERAGRFHGWLILEGSEIAGTIALEDVRRVDTGTPPSATGSTTTRGAAASPREP